jgi:hypothetical protein
MIDRLHKKRLFVFLVSLTQTCMPLYAANNSVEYVDALSKPQVRTIRTNTLCRGASYEGGVSKSNTKTIRECIGPNLRKVVVLSVQNFETHDLFGLAKQAIDDALDKSPKTIYAYTPWANAVSPMFVARLEYANGKTGELEMAYGYMCFQDENGKHWWTRFASAIDLNAPATLDQSHRSLQAEIKVSKRIFKAAESKQFCVYFKLFNGMGQVQNPEIGASKLIVNKKVLNDSIVIFGNGPRDKRFDALPPGETLEFSYALGSYFSKPGSYEVVWKGNTFESAPEHLMVTK